MSNLIKKLLYGNTSKSDLTSEKLQSRTKLQLFFDIFRMKLFDMIKLNLILVIFSVPLIVWTAIYFIISPGLSINPIQANSYSIVFTAGLIPCLMILSPALSGSVYILNNFIQSKHTWIWSDFWQYTKKNAKQSIGYMALFSSFIALCQLVLYGYHILLSNQHSLLLAAAQTIVVFINIIVILSSMFVYPMIVLYRLKLKDIIKNSFIFCVHKPLRTFIFFILSISPIIVFQLLSLIIPVVGRFFSGVYFAMLGITFAMYVLVTYTNETFRQYFNPK